ncbi:TadE/TadG family type IV pilus assembly protein [Rugamonas sp. DEMB1]|uniref:TadE/TadG family type IV pilus assembly protein n=1 Tax=Rugamonas sp. DEMB1 TaxID=3039386 RepID=UPI002448E159|nr:TadE/TadG family type IV pilus assembly protein [Rugamonas sp. DEMB1]WGG52600.1 TadE/TadG family type IV pilus assembly protein [Rugamonas sp. DEMB1]
MRKHIQAQLGSVVVEFALVLLIFLMLAFGVIELARVMYLFNTLEEVTRRAANLASNTDFTNEAAKTALRQAAIFRSSAGPLILGAPITDGHVRIDYLSLPRAGNGTGSMTLTEIPTANMPSCVANNRITCMTDPNSLNCVRFVRVRICDPLDTSTCASVPYQSIISMIGIQGNLPKATRIVAAESLGFTPGMATCF